jgi:hypothetical protein
MELDSLLLVRQLQERQYALRRQIERSKQLRDDVEHTVAAARRELRRTVPPPPLSSCIVA